jgi:peptidoglycan hydrolase-like protein with peptidoglycan-binding domain
MSKLFLISEEEKNRILNLHEYAIKREMVSQKKIVKTLNEDEVALPGYEGVSLGKVEAVQQALEDAGYSVGPKGVDGKFGKDTRAAVIKYQKDNGITPAVGNVGPITAGKLGVQQLTSSVSSSGSKQSSTSAASPFKSREEGNNFRAWANDNYPKTSAALKLDRVGPSNSQTIISAWGKKIGDKTLGQLFQERSNKQSTQPQPKKDQLAIAPGLNPDVFKNINIAALDSTKSTKVCSKAGTDECGTYVNLLSDKVDSVGNAWLAHNNDRIGSRTKTAYWGLTPAQQETIFNIFKAIEKQGGPQKRDSGGQVETIKALQQQLIKPISASDLKPGDIVGIYYPPSGYHENAFHEAGKSYFVKDSKGQWQKGTTIKRGEGFGMNTHVGIVAFQKDGVPLVVHNVGGTVYSDPYNALKGGGKIMWIRRP